MPVTVTISDKQMQTLLDVLWDRGLESLDKDLGPIITEAIINDQSAIDRMKNKLTENIIEEGCSEYGFLTDYLQDEICNRVKEIVGKMFPEDEIIEVARQIIGNKHE